MAPGLPARMLVVCMVAVPVAAWAEKRPVAVIDLSEDPGAEKVSQEVYDALLGDDALRPLANRALEPALIGPLLDEDQPHLDRARKAKQTAEDLLAQFELKAAETAATDGLAALGDATPTAAALELYAELAFALGQAQLSLRKPNDASLAFALTHRLDPMKQPDPARYVPAITGAFEAAVRRTPPPAKLDVDGAGRIWLDGIEVGAAPASLDVAAGLHLVQLIGPERETRGELVTAPARVTIPAAPADDALLVRRARRALAHTTDPAARAGTMQQLTGLLGVHDAVLISKVNGRLQTETVTTKDGALVFSALRDATGVPADQLLAPLSPPKPVVIRVEPPQPPLPPPAIVVEPEWYQKRWVQASGALGVALAIVGGFLYARRDETITFKPTISSSQ